jgi:hypothetical protein
MIVSPMNLNVEKDAQKGSSHVRKLVNLKPLYYFMV